MHHEQQPDRHSGAVGRVHPTALGDGTRVDGWRVLWRHELGTFGVVYLAVRVGQEATGPYALKLARSQGDARLEREVGLLERTQHPNVPRLRGHGQWYGFPYVVMDWVEGPALYRWALLGNPSRRQVMLLLAKVASALAAVHAVGGAHRDMKGDNVLVRLADGEPMLTDFGAGTWEGAAALTVQGPPGTPLYFSPERLRSHLHLLPPGSPSGAGPADDVYGLGVTAFRLLTDSYPFLEVDEAQRTQERLAGRLPRAPHELNPGVPQELSALVLRMLASRLEQRPAAQEVAQALEAQSAGESQEEPLFAWETEPERLGPGRRVRSRVEYEQWLVHARIEEGQRRMAAELERAQAAKKHAPTPPPLSRHAISWHQVAGAVLVLAVLAASVLGRGWQLTQEPSSPPDPGNEAVQRAQTPGNTGTPDAGTVGMGDEVLAAASANGASTTRPGVSVNMLDKPLPGQKLPPCDPRWEVKLHGGCWFPHPTVSPPCSKGEYEWQGACYFPVRTETRPNTAEPP
jgi:serine/threonine protein kinase